MRGINGNRGHSSVKESGNLNLSCIKFLLISNSIMVGVDRHRNGNSKLVAEGIDEHCHIPVVHCAIGFCTSFRFCDLDHNGSVSPLGGLEGSSNDKLISAVCSHCNRSPFSNHGSIYQFSAPDQVF